MNKRFFILIVIVGIFLFIIGVEYYQRVKLKQRIKSQWGKFLISQDLIKKKV